MNAFVVDIFEFCRLGERREGRIAIADLGRLSKECAGSSSGMLDWALQGGIGMFGRPQLTLSVSASVQLACQRCLAPFVFDIRSESLLILARDEAEADEIEGKLEDEDEVDVIVGSETQDILQLIEDDALLALPLSPKHEVCPGKTALDEVGENKPSPFAALKAIKR
ncbi:MAG: hypothetical protein H6R01_797 [Burkholderiaceae bacterium]|nr:hypothetical protein [Burkholderiaceae bacterium]